MKGVVTVKKLQYKMQLSGDFKITIFLKTQNQIQFFMHFHLKSLFFSWQFQMDP